MTTNKKERKDFNRNMVITDMIHDLRGPLNSILGSAQILNMRDHYPDQQEFIDAIFQAGQALMNLVEDLKSLSSEDGGEIDIKVEPFNVRALVEEVTNMMNYQAQQKGLPLFMSVSDDVPEYVEGVPSIVRRVLFNLVSNAIKFTASGTIEIHVDMEGGDDQERELLLSVIDTGPGIPRKYHESIFSRGKKLHDQTDSSGLGLYIVRNLIRMLNGDIRVESEPGKGSAFTCVVPIDSTHRSEAALQSARLSYSRLNFLIISDDDVFADTVSQAIPVKKSMSSSHDAFATLERAQKGSERFQVALMDGQLDITWQEQFIAQLQEKGLLDRLMVVRLAVGEEDLPQLPEVENLTLPQQASAIDWQASIQNAWDKWLKQKAQANLLRNQTVRVLLVENDEASKQIAQAMLEGLECTVDVAVSGEQAEKLFRSNDYDIVFMDIGLGDKSGFEVAQSLRAMEKGQNPVPIVALTAHALANYEQRSFKSGMNAFMTKPVLYDDFQRVLKKFIYNS